MSDSKPQAIHRKDYRPPHFRIDSVDLHFDLQEELTTVRAKLAFRRDETAPGDAPLVLQGEKLALKSISLDGCALPADAYRISEEELTVPSVPDAFELETQVAIKPQENTELSGLYKSSGNFCTQCEAEGFRRITYFLDRPDVMSRYTTTIVADKKQYPVLLSNGNRVETTDCDDGRHTVKWEDPFPKPSYLFALVAGDLRCHSGSFRTRSGRDVRLEIWVEPQNIKSCDHALKSLQKSMKWDEDVFDLEYDLDIYMIVAVGDFNMGAMENKGLNIFNSKYVLARPETATDDDYEGVEGVIAHEYFHNWTGNRVTCRDWFQLTLKEGLTVFRDQLFSADMTSAPVKRISEVRGLRLRQFAEDAGPMAHPIRPESYIAMDNFYTATVYQKGAEVIRMYHTLLGKDGFRKGMDLYFKRHDGDAVTCDDFRAAMADANGKDLTEFENWYLQAGTPIVEAEGKHDPQTETHALTLRQSYPPPFKDSKPLHIPVAVGLLGPQGEDLPMRLEGEEQAPTGSTRVLELKDAEATFVFTGLKQSPVPSLLRDFSAPARLKMDRKREELAFLMGNDSDPFNRWDAGQTLAQELLLELAHAVAEERNLKLDPLFVEAFGRVLTDARLDGSMKALALALPAEDQLAQEVEVVHVDAIHDAREFVLRELAKSHRGKLLEAYRQNTVEGPYRNDQHSINRRRIKNAALRYLSVLEEPETTDLVVQQFKSADNMTDSQAALILLSDMDTPERDEALRAFYEKWKDDPLVIDKWFAVQATSKRKDTLDRVLELTEHPAFNWKNPNRLRALVGAFCMANPVRFHQADGRGYAFLGDMAIRLDSANPQVASRMVSGFNQWRRYDEGRKSLMKAQLERIAAKPELSKDVFEVVSRALGK